VEPNEINFNTYRLLMMLKQILNMEFNEYLVMIFTRSICSIILQGNVLLLESFQKHGMIPLLISKRYYKLFRRQVKIDVIFLQ